MVPAHAGVILSALFIDLLTDRGSRTRGGDPAYGKSAGSLTEWFPHTRG